MFTEGRTDAKTYKALFAFGDSYADTGNRDKFDSTLNLIGEAGNRDKFDSTLNLIGEANNAPWRIPSCTKLPQNKGIKWF